LTLWKEWGTWHTKSVHPVKGCVPLNSHMQLYQNQKSNQQCHKVKVKVKTPSFFSSISYCSHILPTIMIFHMLRFCTTPLRPQWTATRCTPTLSPTKMPLSSSSCCYMIRACIIMLFMTRNSFIFHCINFSPSTTPSNTSTFVNKGRCIWWKASCMLATSIWWKASFMLSTWIWEKPWRSIARVFTPPFVLVLQTELPSWPVKRKVILFEMWRYETKTCL